MNLILRRLAKTDKEWIDEIIFKEWGEKFIITNNKTYFPSDLNGFIVEINRERIGLLTYIVEDKKCVIVSLNSLRENQGVGSLLLNELKTTASQKNCHLITAETSNDNVEALRFYQKRGYRITAVYPNAIDEVRKMKPHIPLLGKHGIPLRDVIELEFKI